MIILWLIAVLIVIIGIALFSIVLDFFLTEWDQQHRWTLAKFILACLMAFVVVVITLAEILLFSTW